MRSLRLLKFSVMLSIVLILSLAITSGALGVAAKAELEAETMTIDETVQLTIAVTGAFSANQPRVITPDSLSLRFVGQSSENQWINGRSSSLVSFQYLITAVKPGQYKLGPFQVTVNGKEFTTNSVTLQVRSEDSSTGARSNSVVKSDEPLLLEIRPAKSRAFLGERLPVTIRLYVKDIQLNDLSYPVLNQPEFVTAKMAKPVTQRTVRNGQTYQIVEFTTTIIPVKTGTFSLGPATVDCEVLVPVHSRDPFLDDFFNDYQKQTIRVKSKSLQFTALDIPGAKPADFTGGVGQFKLSVSATPQQVAQGDPVTVKLTLTGAGNFDTMGPPVLSGQNGFKVYAPQRKNGSSANSQNNQVLFEQVLIPLDAKLKQLPSYSLSFFNPATQRFERVTSPALSLAVKANPNFHADQSIGQISQSPATGQDLVYIKENLGNLRKAQQSLADQPWFWWLQLLPLLALAGAIAFRRIQRRLQSDTPAARSVRANQQATRQLQQIQELIANQNYAGLLDRLSGILREFLGEKYQLPPAGITGAVVAELADQEVPTETLSLIKEFFDQYDFYRFTGAKLQSDAARRLCETIQTIVKGLENHQGSDRQSQTGLRRVV